MRWLKWNMASIKQVPDNDPNADGRWTVVLMEHDDYYRICFKKVRPLMYPAEILNSYCEPGFHAVSYSFRRERACHV